ncbi:SGNH/GDSL hydrolase family protein [Nocardia sp. NPDC057668]|uniref:SGNH/GDSL hydrolase family protein n=1 Tax=Nocardia sp. NPDC057668 TaxID=3346202 RepID=UPI00366BFE3A
MRKLSLVLAVVAGAALCAAAPAHSAPAVRKYVALGDSYAATADVTDVYGPVLCLRSRGSYPNRLVAALAPQTFVDNTCSGAVARELAAKQFDGLDAQTDLVTVTMGWNDLDLLGTLGPCLAVSLLETPFTPVGNPCERQFTGTGADTLAARVENEARPAVAGALRAIRDRAPNAVIVAVNYPSVLPATTAECGYATGVARADVPYVYRTLRHISVMLLEEAAKLGATTVDANAVTGHDGCQPAARRWVEPLISATTTIPLHPNPRGAQAVADLVRAALDE